MGRLPTIIAAAALLGSGAAHAEMGPWKLISGQNDPLTEKPARYALDFTQSKPLFHGKPISSALAIRCATPNLNAPSKPQLMLLFTGMTELGHKRSVLAHYRWDEGTIHSYKLDPGGTKGTRAIVLPRLISPTPLVQSEDPIPDMLAAKRFRAEIQFGMEGKVFVDFNVANGGDAIRAVACQ